jgi:hypothetical protein
MADNKQIKDGLGNLFTMRMLDISSAEDGTVQRSMVLSTPQPVDYGAGGSYHRTGKSGAMAAGLAAAAPIYAFQFTSATLLALVRRVRYQAWTLGTGFAAGIASVDMYIARAFTAQLTGGTVVDLTGNSSKLKTAMASSSASVVRAAAAQLAGGTYTLDPSMLETWNTAAPVGATTPFNATVINLFNKTQGDVPMVLAQNEGFILQATVPATGLWTFAVTTEWDEVPLNCGY